MSEEEKKEVNRRRELPGAGRRSARAGHRRAVRDGGVGRRAGGNGGGVAADGDPGRVPERWRPMRRRGPRPQTAGARNSPYTSALLAYLEEPLELSALFRRVRGRVLESTDGQQRQHEYGSLLREHYLRRVPGPAAVAVAAADGAAARLQQETVFYCLGNSVLGERWSRRACETAVVLQFTPSHSPRLTQIESWFSEVWRELARPRERAEWTDPVIEGEV